MAQRRRQAPKEPGQDEIVKELAQDLARKYKLHKPKIESLWRSFDAHQRSKAFKAGAAQGVVLKHAGDASLGDVYKYIPELNLRDVAESGPEYMLKHLEHRATGSLLDQYQEGVDGSLGDAEFIKNSMRTKNLRHANEFKYCFTMFMDEAKYGKSYAVVDSDKYAQMMVSLSPSVQAGVCVPQSTGELILTRQMYMLQCFHVLIDDILESSSTRTKSTRPTKTKAPELSASHSAGVVKPEKLTVDQLRDSVVDIKSSLEEQLQLCYTEPTVLAHYLNLWFFSRPEMLSDEKGRALPMHTDRYISSSFYRAFIEAVTGIANWDYLDRLLKLLSAEGPPDKLRQTRILQEISNVCQIEYLRVQTMFKRMVQIGLGRKFFNRVSGVYDRGIPRVRMMIKPEALTRDNPQLHYVLRLCQAETDPSKAGQWINKLDELHRNHPSDREDMGEKEYENFSELAAIVNFIQNLTSSLPLPSPKLKKGSIYPPRAGSLAEELVALEMDVDLSAFVVPIDNLLEPEVAHNALKALDQFITVKTGTKLGRLHSDLVGSCITELLFSYELQKAKLNAQREPEPPSDLIEASTPEALIQQRKQKEKSRPAHSSVYDIVAPAPVPAPAPESTPKETYKVKQSTYDVFSTLFTRSQSQGSISWTVFAAAMADLNFSVIPKLGSVYAFQPPEDLGVSRSLTLHRPHGANIEGRKLLFFATRLQKAYGWGEDSFEVV